MNFGSLYLLCSIALITDVRRSISLLCPHKLLYISFTQQGLLFKVLERLVVQLFDWMDPVCALAKSDVWHRCGFRAVLTVFQILELRLLHLWLLLPQPWQSPAHA